MNRVDYNPSVTQWVQLQAGVTAPDICFSSSWRHVSATAAPLAFCFSHRSPACTGTSMALYPGSGMWVWVWMRQGIVLPTAGKGVERMEWSEGSHGTGNHGYGVWCHERDVIWWTPHGQGVVGWAGSPHHHVLGVQRVAYTSAVSIQVWMLLHLKRHYFFLLRVGQVICSTPLGATAPMDIMPPFVLFIVKSGKGKNIEEKQGSSYSNSHGQFCGVVTLVYQVRLVVTVLGLSGKWSWVRALGHQNFGFRCAVGCFWWRNLKQKTTRKYMFKVSSRVQASRSVGIDTTTIISF